LTFINSNIDICQFPNRWKLIKTKSIEV